MEDFTADVEMHDMAAADTSVEQLANHDIANAETVQQNTRQYFSTDATAQQGPEEHLEGDEQLQQIQAEEVKQTCKPKAQQLLQESEQIRQILKAADPDLDIFVPTMAAAERIIDILRAVPEELTPHKTYGIDCMCALRALATSIAGTQAFRCAWRRKQYESALYTELEGYWKSADFQKQRETRLLKAVGMVHPDQWAAVLKDVALVERNFLSAHSIHFLLETYAARHGWAGRYELIVLSYQADGKTLVGAEVYVQRGVGQSAEGDDDQGSEPPGQRNIQLVLRNISNYHWEGYAPVLDRRDISGDGQLARLDPVDPRLNNGALPSDHPCQDDSTFPCFPQVYTARETTEARRKRAYSPDMETARVRRALIENAREQWGIINPPAIPKGLGDWSWLQPGVDDEFAKELGYVDPQHVTLARSKGELKHGYDQRDVPVVVFAPDLEYLNPSAMPGEAGQFMYLTENDEWVAECRFGGQLMYGFADVMVPSAYQLWCLRRERSAHGQAFEDNIAIVWIPGALGNAVMEADTRAFEQRTSGQNRSARAKANQRRSEAAQLRDKLGVAALTAAQTQVFSKAPVLWRDDNATFPKLKSADFSDLRSLLKTWFSCLDFIQTHPGAARTCMLIPLHVLVVKALNDRSSQSRIPGKLRHHYRLEPPRAHDESSHMNGWLALFAATTWSDNESEEWSRRPPREQLNMSDIVTDWMWKEPETPLLPLAILHSKQTPSAGDFAYVFELPWEFSDEGEANKFQKNGPLIVLCTPNEIIPVAIKDIYECKEMKLTWNVDKPHCYWSWTYRSDNEQCHEWAMKNKLADDGDLAELLLKFIYDTHSTVRSGFRKDFEKPHRYVWSDSATGCRLMTWSMMWNLLNKGE